MQASKCADGCRHPQTLLLTPPDYSLSPSLEASKCAAKSQPERATALLQKAVALYTDMGRLNMAARQLREIAEVNEKQGLKPEAITFYEQAAGGCAMHALGR